MQNNDQPPSASGERDAFEAWYSINAFDYVANPVGSRDCGLQWKAWKARAALAPSPGIDAAGQKPVAWLTSDGKMLVFADKISNGRAKHSGMTPLYAAPPAAQPSAERDAVVWLSQCLTKPGWYEIAEPHQKATNPKHWSDAFPVYAQPPSAQPSGITGQLEPANIPSAEWMAEAERLVDAYANEFAQGGATYARDIRRTALLAHLRSPHAPT